MMCKINTLLKRRLNIHEFCIATKMIQVKIQHNKLPKKLPTTMRGVAKLGKKRDKTLRFIVSRPQHSNDSTPKKPALLGSQRILRSPSTESSFSNYTSTLFKSPSQDGSSIYSSFESGMSSLARSPSDPPSFEKKAPPPPVPSRQGRPSFMRETQFEAQIDQTNLLLNLPSVTDSPTRDPKSQQRMEVMKELVYTDKTYLDDMELLNTVIISLLFLLTIFASCIISLSVNPLFSEKTKSLESFQI
jgi:hypothetical protein